MLGGLLGSLPPQPHEHLGLPITLPALQQLQDGIPCEERRLGGQTAVGVGSAWVVAGDTALTHSPVSLNLVMDTHQPSSQDSLTNEMRHMTALAPTPWPDLHWKRLRAVRLRLELLPFYMRT